MAPCNSDAAPPTVAQTLLAGSILAAEGVPGLYRGVVAVTLKQASNAVVRFTSYNFLLDQTRAMLGDKRNAACSVIAGAGAGLITVYCTMPLDNIKTKLQLIGSRERYSGSWECLKKMVREGGVSSLWTGTSPRLVRLTASLIDPLYVWDSKC